MSITNYAELQLSIAGWSKRTNLTDRVPNFITLAEAQLNRDLRTRQMADYYTRTTNQNIISLPDDYLAAEKSNSTGERSPISTAMRPTRDSSPTRAKTATR